MNILISVNDNYIELAIQLFRSIHFYQNDYLDVYIIYDHLQEESLQLLKQVLEDESIGTLHTIYFDFSEHSFPINIPHITRETYFRLYAPFVLPKKMKKILYLDCDIICNGSIRELYSTDFEDNIFVGVENIDYNPDFKEYINTCLGLPVDNPYINAGVLLINLPKYREFTSIEKINQFIADHYDNLMCQDQDVINKMFYSHIKIVGNEYNYPINHLEVEDLDYDNKVLIHYLSPPKPWLEDYYLPFHGVVYYRYLLRMGEYDKLNYLVLCHIQNAGLNIYDIKNLLYFLD